MELFQRFISALAEKVRGRLEVLSVSAGNITMGSGKYDLRNTPVCCKDQHFYSKIRKALTVLIGKTEAKCSHDKFIRRWEDNVKVYLNELRMT